ncbi:hypothetical protein HPULCUR_011477 [Helicostylum pulchrum]|uniref:C3H1-type domain-containing protein n=1 Tax=Helicostylum pulchrum TaxID=562976 RepID=A0ABP9YG75_9FUNG
MKSLIDYTVVAPNNTSLLAKNDVTPAPSSVTATPEAIKKVVGSPKPAVFNATKALILPKAPKPVLAAHNTTTASITLKEREYINSLPKAPKLTPVDANVARAVANAVSKSVSESPKPSLAACNSTVASQLSQSEQSCQQDKAGSNIEDNSSPSSTAPTSSSSVHSGTNTFADTAAASVTASPAASSSASNEQQSNSNFYGTTWDKLFDESITNNKPLSLNNTTVFNLNNAKNKERSREEKIHKQSQSHLSKMRNRCDYWPACTNKNCKFSHPTAPCRAGDECTFGKRCSYIHPKDLAEPPKKRSNSTGTPNHNSTTGPPKRTASSGGNTHNNNRYSAMSLKK